MAKDSERKREFQRSQTMSIESAKAFLERVRNDEEWRTRLSDAGGKEERLAMVNSEGFEFAEEEFKEAKGELSEAELGSISQGGPHCCSGENWFL